MTIDERIAQLPKRHKIVVVDDDEDHYMLLRIGIRSVLKEFDIMYVGDSQKFLDEFIGGKIDCEIMFIDTNMPKIEGYDLCSRIREVQGDRFIRIYGMSGCTVDFDHYVQKWADAKPDGFYKKEDLHQRKSDVLKRIFSETL